MAAFNKFNCYSEDLAEGVHQLQAAGHTLKVYLSNTAPTATDTVKATGSATEITAGNGYTAGGEDVQNDTSRTGGTTSVTGVDVTWTATGAVGPFRYAVLYNDTPTTPADPLIGWWDYGSSVTLASGETFTTDFGASLFTVA